MVRGIVDPLTDQPPPEAETFGNAGLGTAGLRVFLVGVLGVLLGSGATASGQVQTNSPPTVSIVSPLDGTVSYTTNALLIDVQAADLDGTVTQVALFRDNLLIATSDSAPCEFELIDLPEGTNTYVASATDDQGAATFSAPVLIFERSQPPGFYAPSISLVSPASNAVVIAPTNLTLVAQVTDLGWPIRTVTFAANNVDLGTVTDPPFSWTITNIAIGHYTFAAIVNDTGGYIATSDPLPITVIPDPATTPAVTLVSPTNGASVALGGSVPLSVEVAPQGNTIDHVDFYVDGSPIGSAGVLPYTVQWHPGRVGAACWNAVAVYNGQAASSATACVSVVLAPGSFRQYVVVDMGPLRTNASTAFGLNRLGHFVGQWQKSGGSAEAFLDIDGIPALLDQPPVYTDAATAINDANQVLVNGRQHGYVYQNGQFTDVGSLGGATTFVRGINSTGQVVGDSQFASGQAHAYLYSGQQMIDLGTFSGGTLSQANAINDLGAVAGWAQNSVGERAFI
jgi:probable HAF family extracellular repeat protein